MAIRKHLIDLRSKKLLMFRLQEGFNALGSVYNKCQASTSELPLYDEIIFVNMNKP